jgi:beta-phosphoglucomutase-like phosphatase (HAD superfamily)
MIASRFELVIFDCDGVLVDSEPITNGAHAESFCRPLEREPPMLVFRIAPF